MCELKGGRRMRRDSACPGPLSAASSSDSTVLCRRAIRKGMSDCLSPYTRSKANHSSSPSSFDAVFAHRCSEIVESESRLSVLISERRRDGSVLALVQALPGYWLRCPTFCFPLAACAAEALVPLTAWEVLPGPAIARVRAYASASPAISLTNFCAASPNRRVLHGD